MFKAEGHLDQANIYLFKVNNRDFRERWEICSELTIKISERRQWRRFGVFIVNFEHISHFFSSVSIVDYKQLNVSWDCLPVFSNCNYLLCCNINFESWPTKIHRVYILLVIYFCQVGFCKMQFVHHYLMSCLGPIISWFTSLYHIIVWACVWCQWNISFMARESVGM